MIETSTGWVFRPKGCPGHPELTEDTSGLAEIKGREVPLTLVDFESSGYAMIFRYYYLRFVRLEKVVPVITHDYLTVRHA